MSPANNERSRERERKVDERRRAGQAERRKADLVERERAFRLQLLADVGRRTTAILSRTELMRSSVQIIQETFRYFMVNIFLVEGDSVVLRACSIPEFEGRIDKLRMRIGQDGINGWVPNVLAAHHLGTGWTSTLPAIIRSCRRLPRQRLRPGPMAS